MLSCFKVLPAPRRLPLSLAFALLTGWAGAPLPAHEPDVPASFTASARGQFVPPVMDQAAIDWLNSDGSAAFGRWLTAQLEADTSHPEWLDMFADILQGSRLGPDDGWFRKAVAKSRYSWDAVQARFDRDGNGKISRTEFPGPDADFQRLDRDGNRDITLVDLSWPENALADGPGASLYYLADGNADGKVSFQELEAVFRAADRDGLGFLSQDDLRSLLPAEPPAPKPTPAPATPVPAQPPAPRPGGPTKATLVRGLFQQEIGALKPGPAVDELAPNFSLKPAAGSSEPYTLAAHLGQKPVVLIFGNITCGPFRSQAGNIEKLYHRYKDRAEFVMVYVREAHPTDGWHMKFNDRYGVTLAQPKTIEERTAAAQQCRQKLDFDMPFLVDTMDDTVGGTYSGMPSRLYVIDRQGKVAFKSGRGPFGFKPAEMEQSLLWELAEPVAVK